MTSSPIGNGMIVGQSSDTKPTMPLGFQFYELDTGDTFISDGKFWWIKGIPSPLSKKRIGIFGNGQSGTAGFGIMNSLSNATGIGSQAFQITDIVGGRYLTCITGTTLGNKGGVRVASYQFIRQWNPMIRFRFKVVSNTLARLYLGFVGGSPTELTGDDPLGTGVPAVVFGFKSGDTNFGILHNDSTVATTVTDDTTIPIDTTSIHTVSIVADDAGAKFWWNYDGGTYTAVPTRIPSSINALSLILQNETNESGVAKSFNLYNAFVQSDR